MLNLRMRLWLVVMIAFSLKRNDCIYEKKKKKMSVMAYFVQQIPKIKLIRTVNLLLKPDGIFSAKIKSKSALMHLQSCLVSSVCWKCGSFF